MPIIRYNKKQRALSRASKRKASPAAGFGEAPAGDGKREVIRMSKSPRLKVRVDQEKCQGHARCKSLAPELFELDEYGNAHEVGDGSVPEGLEDKAWLAQSNCPEIAIEVTEE
jgi:ferredoxin